MPTFTGMTKASVIEWPSPEIRHGADDVEFCLKRVTKVFEMQQQGKTDGYCDDWTDPNVGVRHFIDEAAAQEYIDYIVEIAGADQHDRQIVSTRIIDL